MLSSLSNDSAVAPAAYSVGTRQSAWPTLLVVDTDVEMTRRIACHFEKRGIHVAAITSFAEARELFYRCKTWTYIVSNCHLPDATGVELQDWLQAQGCNTPVLLTSANPHYGAGGSGSNFLAKPFSMETLENVIRRRGPAS